MRRLSTEQELVLQNVKKAVADRIAPVAAATDREGQFNWEVANLFWELGLFSIILPVEHGGVEESPCMTLCLCVEEIAKACASSALMLIIQAVGAFPLIKAGSPALHEKYLPLISEGRTLTAYLVTEPGAGSDVANITTRAERKDGGFLLNGRKAFATNGGVAGLYSVLARTGSKELSFFVVERNTPGLSVGKAEDKCGFRGSNTTDVILEDVFVPTENLLGEPGDGFNIAMADFDMSRPAVAALALGLAEGALTQGLAYAKQRETFGKPLASHQAIQFMMVDAWTAIEAGRGLMEKAADAYDSGQRNTALASMAKCFCSDAAMRITTDMVQVLGGYGYVKDFPLERMFRDAKLTQIFEGANQIQRRIISREMLSHGLSF